jgi:hypothetical protein
MGVSYTFAEGLLLVTADESATASDWTAAVEEALASPLFEPGMPVVADARRMARIPSTKDVLARVEFIAAFSKGGRISRWALVMVEGVQYGMGRMAEAYTEGRSSPFRVFTRLDDAKSWARGGSD